MLHAIQAMPHEQCYLSTRFALKIQHYKFLITLKITSQEVGEGSVCTKVPSTADQHTTEGTLLENLFSDRSWPDFILQMRVQQSSPPETKHTKSKKETQNHVIAFGTKGSFFITWHEESLWWVDAKLNASMRIYMPFICLYSHPSLNHALII